MDLIQLGRLQLAGGQVLLRYEELVREADTSAHGSLAEAVKARFEQLWQSSPNELAEQVRTELAERAAAAEAAAQAAGN
jgi:hypothetical protein